MGFSFYSYPGAEHSRFGHSLGVLYNAHCILKSIGKATDDSEIFEGNLSRPELLEHQSVRLAALLHDIGTFPFSHTIENSYIKYGETADPEADRFDNHEHLGSFIIKRTKMEGGITFILEKFGVDPQLISDLVKGVGKSTLVNQILHSEIDCDRMDYLLRDAHYTGLQYGAYDREYLLHHFDTFDIAGQEILVIKEKAINCIQDFLISRFAWYSQVVRSARGAKFDALAEELAFYLLKNRMIYRYGELLEFIEKDPLKFFGYNDHYFSTRLLELYQTKKLAGVPRINSMAKSLLFEVSPRTIKDDAFKQRILDQNDQSENTKILKKARDRYQEMREYLQKQGKAEDWIIEDFPKKDIYLVKSHKRVVKDKTQANVLLERDPVKILTESGNVLLLSNFENNLVSKLQRNFNFIPHVFCSQSAYESLEAGGFIQ